MQEIFSPKFSMDHPDYALECEEALDLHVQELIEDAVRAAWDTRTIFKALAKLAAAEAIAYEEDPDRIHPAKAAELMI
ncbi:hypothetical protein ASG39_22830 [Rhizobium sp. Leaf371]|uniref:hypothetical protein n=1 Tax=Rhizobium sp. Leaf371 TaxID=1736355 RepID=UPI0007127D11|nr:hypothetical protein [Rhizobium sp. Leaf371]KQS67563.1 hypothetical protein ASG39_22830 [Rhizobium sp. Leaf371]